MPIRKFQKNPPIARSDRMRPRMFLKPNIPRCQRHIQPRHLLRSQILLPQQPIYRPRRHRRQKLPVRIRPQVLRPARHQQRPRRNQRQQHLRIHRHIVPMPHIPRHIPRKLPRKTLHHIINRLPKITPPQRRSQLPRATRKNQRDPLILRARPQHRLAQPRMPHQGNPLRIHHRIGLQIIHNPAHSPRPRADRSPFLRPRTCFPIQCRPNHP